MFSKVSGLNCETLLIMNSLTYFSRILLKLELITFFSLFRMLKRLFSKNSLQWLLPFLLTYVTFDSCLLSNHCQYNKIYLYFVRFSFYRLPNWKHNTVKLVFTLPVSMFLSFCNWLSAVILSRTNTFISASALWSVWSWCCISPNSLIW